MTTTLVRTGAISSLPVPASAKVGTRAGEQRGRHNREAGIDPPGAGNGRGARRARAAPRPAGGEQEACVRLQAAGRLRPRQRGEGHGGEQQIDERIGQWRQQRIGLGQREVPQGCIARLIDVRAREPRASAIRRIQGQGRGRSQGGPGYTQHQAAKPREIAPKGEPSQQRAVEEEREDARRRPARWRWRAFPRCGSRARERQRDVARRSPGRASPRPMWKLESAEQRGVAGEEGEPYPVRAPKTARLRAMTPVGDGARSEEDECGAKGGGQGQRGSAAPTWRRSLLLETPGPPGRRA